MRFTMHIDMENDAFSDPGELPLLVRGVAIKLAGEPLTREQESWHLSGSIRDTNGNRCGEWEVAPS